MSALQTQVSDKINFPRLYLQKPDITKRSFEFLENANQSAVKTYNPTENRPDNVILQERLFTALAEAKVLTSQVAMHLNRSWRDRFFANLDRLHDPEDWEDGDEAIVGGSVLAFLRAMFLWLPKTTPGIALSNRGNIVSVWGRDLERLTVEFYPEVELAWLVTRQIEGFVERTSGLTIDSAMMRVLSPYPQRAWFDAPNEKI
jgi:hypothetical protein